MTDVFDPDRPIILATRLALPLPVIGLMALSRNNRPRRNGVMHLSACACTQDIHTPPFPKALQRLVSAGQIITLKSERPEQVVDMLIERGGVPGKTSPPIIDLAAGTGLETADDAVDLDEIACRIAIDETLRASARNDIDARLQLMREIFTTLMSRQRTYRTPMRDAREARAGMSAAPPLEVPRPNPALPAPDLPRLSRGRPWRSDPWTAQERAAVCARFIATRDLVQLSQRSGRSPFAIRSMLVREGVCARDTQKMS